MGGIRVITGDVIFDLPFYNAKGILTGGRYLWTAVPDRKAHGRA